MNRRSFIAALASLPLIGKWFQTPLERTTPSLAYGVSRRRLTRRYTGPLYAVSTPDGPVDVSDPKDEPPNTGIIRYYDQSANGRDLA